MPDSSARIIRVFLASPGDVTEERAQARHLIKDDLPTLPFIEDEAWLKIVAWEDPSSRAPMPATLSPQRAIELGMTRPSECDIVVVVLWSRMGTPLDEARHGLKDGKRPYWSGTEWEYEDALKASEASGKPVVLVYRRTAKVPLNVEDHDFDERVEQYKRVKEFFAEFRDPATGAWLRSYTEYETPEQFGEMLKNDMLHYIKAMLDEPPPVVSPPETPPEKTAWPTGKSPFPGLRAFTPDDATIFFGRSRETDALLKRVSEGRFVAVVGASGSGKSSLVGAGLIPRLLDNAIPGGKDWLWARFTPGELGGNPFLALATALKHGWHDHPATLADQLAADPGALGAVCERALADQPEWTELLLFVDQFEELFTVASPEHRAHFVDLLAATATTERLRTVLTLRADFYHRCVEYPRLAELLRTGSFPLAAPELDALLEMIERPAVMAGLEFDQGLPGRILRDTGQEPGALALMAYTLDELYKLAEARGDRCLTFADYQALGGVERAIGTRAENVFEALDAEAQVTLPHVFRELVEVDERGTATRQRVPIAVFEDHAATMTLLARFTDARLLTTSGNDRDAVVEVAHEALFRSWPRLATWIDDTQADLFLLRQLRQAVELWQRNDYRDDFLWTGQRLKDAQDMVRRLNPRLSDDEREFLRSEVERLEDKLKDLGLDHAARARIGEQLHIIGDTRPGVGLRPDGLPDIAWCPVPGGTITLKDNAGTFTVKPFYIAKYPVTYVQVQAFLDDPDGLGRDDWWEGLTSRFQKRAMEGQRFKFSNHPRDSVSWYQAVAFSRWLNARLPADGWPKPLPEDAHVHGLVDRLLRKSEPPVWEIRLPAEWEWQQAATGGQPDYEFPWGPDWEKMRRCNTTESGLGRTTAVGVYPHGASLVGALDMSGNVREWCLNEYANPKNTGLGGEAARVLRGGSWSNGVLSARCASRLMYYPSSTLNNHGFRVVCSAPMP